MMFLSELWRDKEMLHTATLWAQDGNNVKVLKQAKKAQQRLWAQSRWR